MSTADTSPLEQLTINSAGNRSTLGYRAEIDGLRAVAVLVVVLYHLNTTNCFGGFVGVDVFFVISGYLISSIMMADIELGSFSLRGFYERRIRRIWPGLFVTLLAVTIWGYIVLFPAERKRLGESMFAAILSLSNFYFWRHSGYFAPEAKSSPLIHTWSLAIEEQFYLILPLVLISLRRLSRPKLAALLAFVAMASLGVSVSGALNHKYGAFYLLHSRGWELLLGTLLAMIPQSFQIPSAIEKLAPALGLTFILIPAWTYTDKTPFPGLAALPPCLGSALVLMSGRSRSPSVTLRVLSLKPLRMIGLLSYSLYLWHWPIIVFAHESLYISSHVRGRALTIFLFALSLAAAFLSWRFVEVPCRLGKFRPSRTYLLLGAAASASALAVASMVSIVSPRSSSRWSPEAARLAAYLDYDSHSEFREGSCFVNVLSSDASQHVFTTSTCLKESSSRNNYLLVGDSHAANLWYGLANTFTDVNFMQGTGAGCVPLYDKSAAHHFEAGTAQFSPGTCRDLMSFLFDEYIPLHHPDRLLLAGRWSAKDLETLPDTLRWATEQGLKVSLFGPQVEYDFPLPKLLALSIEDNDIGLPNQHIVPGLMRREIEVRKVAQSVPGVTYISLLRPICSPYPPNCATTTSQGVPIEFDSNHLTKEGSLMMARFLKTSGGL